MLLPSYLLTVQILSKACWGGWAWGTAAASLLSSFGYEACVIPSPPCLLVSQFP